MCRQRRIEELTPISAYLLGTQKAVEWYTAQGLTQSQARARLLRLGEYVDEQTVMAARRQRAAAMVAA